MTVRFRLPAPGIMKITEKELNKRDLFGNPLIEGKVVADELDNLYNEIISRREELYPGCMDVENDEDFNYINTDWNTYHDYVCMHKFPRLQVLFPVIVECLEAVNENPLDFYFKSWINIWPKGQAINPHRHYGEWHGYWVIRDTGTTTFYTSNELPRRSGGLPNQQEIIGLNNFDGHYVFMPAHMPHWAEKNTSTELRVSMGFNISSWSEVLREEEHDHNSRGSKIRDVVLPLKDYL